MEESRFPLPYNRFKRGYDECIQRFGIIEKLPIISSAYQRCQELYQGGKVLDIGAGVSKPLKIVLSLSDVKYDSLDNDPEGDFSFRDWEEISSEARYTLVVAN